MPLQRPNDPIRDRNATNRPMANDANLQADPEMQEGPASTGRIAIYAAALAILLGAVFYGLNNSGTDSNSTAQAPATSTTSTADNGATGNTAPPVRDVSPNREPGMTTGAAPAQTVTPVQPPQSNPNGQQIDRSKGPAQ